MSITCVLLLILGLLIGGVIGLWSVRNKDEQVVVVEESNPFTSGKGVIMETPSKKEDTKKDDPVIQLGGQTKGESGKKDKRS